MKHVIQKHLFWASFGLLLTSAIGWLDWVTGHELSIFVLYFIPIGLIAWHFGLITVIGESLICAVFWFGADALAGHVYSNHAFAVGNTLVRLCAFIAMGSAIHRIRVLLKSERQKSELLRRSIAEVKVLEGILPICAMCKKIRDDGGRWLQIEHYIVNHSHAEFTHGYCPDCARELMEDAGLLHREETT
jgi:hypothetical protein